MLHTEIKYHNPGYDGTGEFSMEGGQPIAISLRGAKITNLEFLTNLSPLALDLSGTPIKDIRPVKGMKLIEIIRCIMQFFPFKAQPAYISHD